MDFVRKLVRGSSSVGSPATQQASNNLGLITLRRQFRDACFLISPLSQTEQEEKLYLILPLFCKVFKNSPSQDMREKFGDVLQFSTQVSRLMVTEIRRRASNKSTEQASVDIANFLIPHANNEAASRGWVLLNTLSLLAAGGQNIVDCMTSMHLPSTLVKCLYLFFDLPVDESECANITANNSPSNAATNQTATNSVSAENKDILQKVFVQTLVRLGGYISPAEELSRKDDLALLFSAVTSWCSPHNTNWRSAASEVLITVSRHGLSHNVVQYIRSKNCIKTCINNLWRATVSPGDDSSTSSQLLDVDLAEQLLCVLRFISNTAEVTQLLLDDFRQHQGYLFIGEFLLKLENSAILSDVHSKALLSVIGAIENLTTCGFNELEPDKTLKSSFQINYKTPVPIGKGETVRNTHAFQVLETLFVRSRTTLLSRAVLDAVFAVYCRDPANYFILTNLNTMSSFSERLSTKDPNLFPQYFAIFEYISLTLGYIPRKELVSISLLLKSESNVQCGIACLRSLQKLLSSNIRTYREVFREVGLLEMLINCLHRYGAMLKASEVSTGDDKREEVTETHHTFGTLTMDVLVEMIQDSCTNAGMFRETGGARCAFNTVSYNDCRYSALSLVEALILQPVAIGNDNDMGTLLGLLSTLSHDDVQLKIDILKSLCKVLSKSSEACVMFQNVGGFINLISIIVSMEGCFSDPVPDSWADQSSHIYILLEVTFHILAVALRSSSNEQYFEMEIGYDSFLSAINGLGCFSQTNTFNSAFEINDSEKPVCLTISLAEQEFPSSCNDARVTDNSTVMRKILCFFKLLHMVACDSFKDDIQSKIEKLEHSISKSSVYSDDSPKSLQRDFTSSYIQHPEIVKTMLQLVSLISVQNFDADEILSVQLYLLEEINSMLNIERNEQIMSGVGLLSTLLMNFEEVLIEDNQPLNPPCQKMLERLATQSVTPQELRKLLRIGKPLNCDNLLLDNGVVSLNRVKSLVSIATPRNIGMVSDMSSQYKPLPAFIEYDMTVQGCSHLFIPSIFPQSASNPSVGTSTVSDERVFPPVHGISVSVWIYVENFCNMQLHPIRILTLERQVLATHQNFTCFSLHISPRRKKLVVSTNENDLASFGPSDNNESKEVAAFNVEHVCVENQWHHVQVTLQRATVLKHSTATAFFNGTLLGVSKLRYIHAYPGGSSQQALTSPIAVHGWVGTTSQLSARSSLVWRLASLRVFDEISSFLPNSATIQTKLGPDYTGNYQNVILPDGNAGAAFLEEHLCFSLLPSSVETVTFAYMQRQRRKFDFKLLAAKVNIDRNDSLTPLDFYANACVHTPGAARSIGAFAVGRKYKDAPRCFIPKGVGRILQDVGGISVALDLVAMATDVEGLYAAVKFLVCVLKSDDRAMMEMEQTKGYQALGIHLKEKKNLLNSHILHLAFSIAGTVDTGQDATASVSNCSAFEYLLCDLELWHNAPQELHRSLFDHFYELLTESSDTKASHRIISGFNLIQRCVNFLYSDVTLSYSTINSVMKVIRAIFNIKTYSKDLICLGQFAVSLITSSALSEKELILTDSLTDFNENQNVGTIDEQIISKRTIHLRNILIQLFLKCVKTPEKLDAVFCEKLENCLGFDWILLFLQAHLHHSTVTAALRLLFTILQCSYQLTNTSIAVTSSTSGISAAALPGYSSASALSVIDRFRIGENFGGWLHGTDIMLDKKEDSLLGFNVRSVHDFASSRCHHAVHADAIALPGFLVLQHLLAYHASSCEVIKLLVQFMLGHYQATQDLEEFTLAGVWKYTQAHTSRMDDNLKLLSSEICQVINSMLRQQLHQDWNSNDESSLIRTVPVVVIGTVEMIYQNDMSQLSSIFTSSEFLTSFILALFPPDELVSFSSPSKDLLSIQGLLPSIPCNANKLSTHPATKSVYALIGSILWDSISSHKTKANYVIDMMFEIPPEKCSISSLKEYITNIVLFFIENPSASMEELMKSYHSASSITFLTSKIVDKVWQNMYSPDDCKKVFNFVIYLISLSQNKPSVHALTSLYRSLSRVILYQLSRRHSTISEQMVVLDSLHCLTTNRNVVFGTKSRDATFLSCLCHCLFMISGDSGGKEFGLESEQRLTTWHVTDVSKQQPVSDSSQGPGAASTRQEKGQELLSNASARVWSEMMSSKKDVLSEIFKVIFHDLGSEQGNLDSARVKIHEAASKAWATYMLLEKKGSAGDSKDSPQQQKLMKRMSNVVLGGTRKQKKEFLNKLARNISIQFKPLIFKSQSAPNSAQPSPRDATVPSWPTATSPFEWMARKRLSLSSTSEVSGSNGSLSSPTRPRESPVNTMVNIIEDFKRDLEMALRLRDVFILEEKSGYTLLQDSHLWTLNHISVVQSLVRLQYNEHEQDESHFKQYSLTEWERTASELTRERGVWGPEGEESLTKWTLDSTEGPCRMRKRMMRDEMFYIRYPHRNHIQYDTMLSKHKKPTSKDSWEYYRRINYLSPYFDPASTTNGKVDKEDPIDETPAEEKSISSSSTSEESNDEAVVLNLCLKCQPNQSDTSLKVHTLKGKEAVACDICGLSLETTDGDEKSADNNETEDGNSELEVKTETETSSSPTANQNDESKKTDASAAKQVSGIAPSDSLASLSDPASQEKDKQDNQTILKLLESGEKIRHMFRSARIQGLDVHEGLLLFGQEHYYIIDGFTMLKSREIRDISSLPGEHEPIIPSSTMPNQDTVKNDASFSDRMCSKFSYADIREVHKRRYLLQNISLEVFNKDGRNCLLVFPQGTRTKVYNKFLSYATTLSDRGKDSISGQRSGLSVEQQGPALLSNFIGEKTVTSRWERGEISNFQYLMHLNTLAGRSYNDLMQYPVFPWIIADYTSEKLDLTDPATFRDLSKPMGSQTPSRLDQYKKRYRDWEELGGIETPPYHYGTHYSSAMIVASYLVRMEPFTQHFLRLQGGHFDLADRMFHSIKDSWISASQKNMADVKELIPEFFYLPEFLLNTNRFDLGQKQNGVQLNDVILPLWAHGSPHEFIRVHREALECDHVSNHLHEWIDLIFGYKQKGEAALESHNVFHHLFYEGEVDIYSIKDPLKRNATIGFINNFGQIPKQLFKRPHPQKKCRNDLAVAGSPDDKVFYRHLETLSCGNPVKEISGRVGHIVPHDRGVLATEQGKMLIPPHNTRYISWGHKDLSVRVGYYESERAMQIFENLGCGEIVCATMATERLLITGDKSTVVHVWEIPAVKDRNKTMTLVKSLYGHTKSVTSLAACAAYGIIVSGSEDGSCILWDLNHLVFVRQLQHHESPISHLCINEKTGTIGTCSGTNLYLWSINGQLIALASALSSNVRNQQITAIAISYLNEWDSNAVITTGHSDGHVRFWGLEHVQVPESAELLDLQIYNDSCNPGRKLPMSIQQVLNANRTPDTLSLTSIGEVAELPWTDVSKVEIAKVESNGSPDTSSPQKTTDTQKPSESLTPGLKWEQQLVLKGKIELPSCHDKSGFTLQPRVTYISMSKDHEKLFVGDEEGRVFVWTSS